jgi:hypothetical protein
MSGFGSTSSAAATVPGWRRGDTVVVLATAVAPDPFDVGDGFSVMLGGTYTEVAAADYDVVDGWGIAHQIFITKLTSSPLFVQVTGSPEMVVASARISATAIAIRGTLDPIDNWLTWFESDSAVLDTDVWDGGLGVAEVPADASVSEDVLAVSFGTVVSPAWPPGPMAAANMPPDAFLVSEDISQSGLGSVGFAVQRRLPDPGGNLGYDLTIDAPAPPEPGAGEPIPAGIGIVWTLMVLPGPDVATYPTQPSPQRLRLGCAETYSAWITDRTYEERVEGIGWSRINWSRSLDEYSRASVTAPDELGGVYCVAKLGGLVPWKYGLVIERNDIEVWKGPIRSVSRPTDQGRSVRSIQIEAVDILGRYEKLPLIYDTPAAYTNVDAGTVFRDILVTHTDSSANGWTLLVPDFITGKTMTRTLRASDNQAAYEVLREIMESSADVTVVNGVLYCFDPNNGWMFANPRYDEVVAGPYNANHDLVYGLFTAEAYSEMPGWSISGQSQGNYVTVASAMVGELGFSKVYRAQDAASQLEYGVLFLRDQQSVQRADATTPVSEDETLQSRANSLLALHAQEPAVVTGGALSEAAPIDMPNLIPGAIWNLDIHDAGYGQLLQQARLKRVDVSVDATSGGIVESVNPTLHPVGYEAEDAFV